MPIQLEKLIDCGKPLAEKSVEEIIEEIDKNWITYLKITPKTVLATYDIPVWAAQKICREINERRKPLRIDEKGDFKFPEVE